MLSFFNKRTPEPDPATPPDARRLKTLEMDLAERDQTIAQLKNDLERERSGAANRVSGSADAALRELCDTLASPVSQLLAQAHLVESEGKDVEARHIIAAAGRLIRALEEHGLEVEARPGDEVAFDPNHHEPASSDTQLAPGEAAVVKIPGLSFKGTLLRKAGVAPKAATAN